MKYLKFFLIYFLFLLLGCSKSKKNIILDNKIDSDSISFYLKKAENKQKSFKIRKYYSKQASELLLKQPNDSLNRENLLKLSNNYFRLNDWENLKKTSNAVYIKSMEKNNQYQIAKAFRYLGLFYESISKNDSAFIYYSKAEKIYIKLNKAKDLSNIYIDKAQVQYYINDYLGSEKMSIKALKIAKDYNLIKEQFYAYKFIGSLSGELNDYETANYYYKKAYFLLKNNTKKFDIVDYVFCLNNIAYNYYKSGQTQRAIFFYRKAIREKKVIIESPTVYSTLLDNYGHALFKVKKNHSMLPGLYNEASKIRNYFHVDNGKNYNKIFLSEYYAATHDTLKSKLYAQEGYELSKNFHNPGDILVSLKQLINVDSKNALKYSQEYIRISDSMQLLERQNRNKFAKIAYETEEITQEKEAAVKKSGIIAIVASVIIVFLILLLIIKLQRAKQKQLQLKQIQQKANEEIYNLMLDQQNKIDLGRDIEKKRIAQDLHDGIMNRLASTRLNLQMIDKNATPETIEKALPFINGIQDVEKEIRNIAHDLNHSGLSNKVSFVAIVESLIEEQKSVSAVRFYLEIDRLINWDLISDYKKIHLFRILQEALQNVNKHAQANTVVVSILKKEDQLLLEIFDDGKGFSLNKKKKGIGLQNIFSRVKSCKGIAEIKTRENEGTTIVVTIPII